MTARNTNGESAPSATSPRVYVAFSTRPAFWRVAGSKDGAELQVIAPDQIAEPENVRYKLAIIKAGDSGSGELRAATVATPLRGTGTLADPLVFQLPLADFQAQYAQVSARLAYRELAVVPGRGGGTPALGVLASASLR